MASLSQPLILVIDADALSLTATAAALHTQQYEVHCARDRVAALQAARQLNLDLIVCDVNLQGVDGVQLCEEIRALPERHDVPIMFISGNQTAGVASRMFHNGSALFLRKPFAPQLLLDLVDKALWMPHLIKSHINRPHIPLGAWQKNSVATPSTTESNGSL
jgi:CheY-like chemotaxis protein